MDTNAIFSKLLDKCDIYYDDKIISKESIIRNYLSFFSKQFDENERRVSFSFHTGSVCFDATALIAVIMGCLAFDISSNDDILNSLSVGDMVIYRGERYKWGGISVDSVGPFVNEQYVTLTQDAKGKNGISVTKVLLKKNKHLIKPYYGDSKTTDGRGIRKVRSDRAGFLSTVLDIPENEVPSSFGISIAVVADKNKIGELCKNLKIVYSGQAAISVADIVPVSYYTSSYEEIRVGKNPSKEEAFIKIASRVSTARDIVLDKSGNRTIGLLALDIGSLENAESEICDLLRRKSLKFVHIASPMNYEMQAFALEKNEGAEIFACTKSYLSKLDKKIKSPNVLTDELGFQIKNVVQHKLHIVDIEGFSWAEYLEIKRKIVAIRQSNWSEDIKNKFIISASGMLNLLTSAYFSFNKMEQSIENGKIISSVVSPKQRLSELRSISERADSLKEICSAVVDSLEAKYRVAVNSSNKETELLRMIRNGVSGKVAVIVPKAYYVDIFSEFFMLWFPNRNITCVTANRFNEYEVYDSVISVGNITGKNFDALQCNSAKDVYVLLYDCERQMFRHSQKKAMSFECKINEKMGIETNISEPDRIEENKDDIKIIQEFSELDRFIDALSSFDINRFVSTGANTFGSSAISAEVKFIGTFTTGEQILFSKYYSAVVFNRGEKKVEELSADRLSQGDVVVFTKRNDYTRNIVDIIFEQLKRNNRLDKKITEASVLAVRWKECLQDYKERHNLSYKALAKSLARFGYEAQVQTVRQWLIPESHIIGPRNEEVFTAIGKMTGDEALASGAAEYFNACRTVRHYRIEILKMIAKAISDSLSMKKPVPGSPLEIVYNNVENLSYMMEIETIHELDEAITVSINMLNKPINLTEMEMLV